MIARAEAEALDAADPLGSWRERFVTPPGLVYLDGNSLGMTPRATVDRLQEVAGTEWAEGLIRAWDHWVDLPRRVGDRVAPIVGAPAGSIVVHDSTTVNLYQAVHAALAIAGDGAIAVDGRDFPTDRYVVAGIAHATGRQVRPTLDDLDGVVVAVRSAVDYRTAERFDIAAETDRGRRAGAVTVWDLSHAAGAVEVDLAAAGVDFAVGCTYKFLHGGPGAPAWAYVRPGLGVEQPIWGWFGQSAQFEMGDAYRPYPDVRRLLLGTPGIHRARRRRGRHRSRRRRRDGGDRRQRPGPHGIRFAAVRRARPRVADAQRRAPARRPRRRARPRRRRGACRADRPWSDHRRPPTGPDPPRLRRPHHPLHRRLGRRPRGAYGDAMTANLDHLVFGAADLATGVAAVAERCGVTPHPGGRHPGFGTHNALTALGGRAYLEVIAPDPEQPTASPMRTMLEALSTPALITWALATTDLATDAERMAAAGFELEPPIDMERPVGDVVLRWQVRRPVDAAGGVVPFLIDWGDSPHPSTTLTHDLALVVLHLTTPHVDRLTAALVALGVHGVEVRHGEHPALWATITGPRGTLSV